MRVLFYTAIAFVFALTGVFTFYAVQSPASMSGTKVVLTIDVSGMPKEADSQGGSPKLYAEDETSQTRGVLGAPSTPRETSGAETATSGTAPDAQLSGSDTQTGGNVSGGSRMAIPEDRAEPAQRVQSVGGSMIGSAPQVPDDLADVVPLERPAPSAAPQPSAQPQQLASVERVQARAETEKDTNDLHVSKHDNGVANLATVEDVPAQGASPSAPATMSSGASAPSPMAQSPQVAAQPAAPLLVTPPLPMRRPSTPPPVKTALAEGWGTSMTNAPTTGGVKVAILLRGIGQDRRDSYDAIAKLPGAISLGVIPTDDAEDMAKKAREKGHEIIVQLPGDLETSSSGFDFLSSSGPKDNAARVQAALGRFKGYTGVTTPAGSKLLQSKEALRPVMQDIKQRNIVFIAEGTNSHALAREMAAELKIRYGNAAVIIDTQPTADGIKAALDRLVAVAQKRGSAIGIGFVSSETIDQLQAWSQGLAAQGVTLVPAVSLAGAL